MQQEYDDTSWQIEQRKLRQERETDAPLIGPMPPYKGRERPTTGFPTLNVAELTDAELEAIANSDAPQAEQARKALDGRT